MRYIILLILLAIAGCGERASGSKSETDAHPPQIKNLNNQFAAGPQTEEEKFAGLQRNAESGDAKSQLVIARMYYNGDGTTRDLAKAAEWYLKSAEQGNALAQYNIGMMYQKGEGVTMDAAKSEEWLKKAAAQGLK